jgi:hypothetical protein
MTETMELDEKAVEAATVAVRNATGLFADSWGAITPSEEAHWHSSGHYATDRNRAIAAIRAYLRTAGLVPVPVIGKVE